MPNGLQDGDDDTTYQGSEGITVDASQTIGFDPSVIQRRVSGECQPGEAAVSVGEDGSVLCGQLPQPPSPGFGLSDSGAVRSVNTNAIQRRVSGACRDDQAMQSVDRDGDVGCGDLPTIPAAGDGLMDSAGTRSVDSVAFQRRVNQVCPSDQAVRAINQDGTVLCERISQGDIEGITTSADSGLTGGCIAGTCILSVDPSDFNGTNPVTSAAVRSAVITPDNEPVDNLRVVTIGQITINAGSHSGEVQATGHVTADCSSCSSSETNVCWVGFSTSNTTNPLGLQLRRLSCERLWDGGRSAIGGG